MKIYHTFPEKFVDMQKRKFPIGKKMAVLATAVILSSFPLSGYTLLPNDQAMAIVEASQNRLMSATVDSVIEQATHNEDGSITVNLTLDNVYQLFQVQYYPNYDSFDQYTGDYSAYITSKMVDAGYYLVDESRDFVIEYNWLNYRDDWNFVNTREIKDARFFFGKTLASNVQEGVPGFAIDITNVRGSLTFAPAKNIEEVSTSVQKNVYRITLPGAEYPVTTYAYCGQQIAY